MTMNSPFIVSFVLYSLLNYTDDSGVAVSSLKGPLGIFVMAGLNYYKCFISGVA